ncbi:MAG TPA: tryptophan synthase subunit alpha [Candidatus Methylacidiphilales bacterium]|jgi:tryptophan synthase alpha chain|nr:tryptophan synthase subunit alpha [Candidatus Methylacidiphilales bacterium]
MNPPTDNRIDRKFRELKARGQKAFVAYITAGDPSPEVTPQLVWALERAGADIVELGVPFSDPLADGVVNQLSAQRALEAGTTTPRVLEILQAVRQQSQIPIVLYTYFNLVYAYGIERFCLQTHQAGADGVLVLDLPPEESQGAAGVGSRLGDGSLRRISLVAPTSPPERIAKIIEKATGFVYYVSREGVTGMQEHVASSIGSRVELLRKHTTLPICVGFGISTPEQAWAVAQQADGAVVGSVLVNRIAEWGRDKDLPQKLEAFARPLAQAIHS